MLVSGYRDLYSLSDEYKLILRRNWPHDWRKPL